MASIIFTIKPTAPGKPGKVDIDAQGFHGEACATAIGPFLQALGGKAEVEHKAEYAEASVDVNLQ